VYASEDSQCKEQLQSESLVVNVRQIEACIMIIHVLYFDLDRFFPSLAKISSGFAKASTRYCFSKRPESSIVYQVLCPGRPSVLPDNLVCITHPSIMFSVCQLALA
jgi:hypothetical protein